MEWYRRYHESESDPKFRVIAKKTGLHLCFVKQVWESVLTYASTFKERGMIDGLSFEDIAINLDIEEKEVEQIVNHFRERNLIKMSRSCHGDVTGHVTNWNKRQTRADEKSDFTATERKRKQREKEKEQTQENKGINKDVTVMSRSCHGRVTDRQDKTRQDKTRTDCENTELVTARDDPPEGFVDLNFLKDDVTCDVKEGQSHIQTYTITKPPQGKFVPIREREEYRQNVLMVAAYSATIKLPGGINRDDYYDAWIALWYERECLRFDNPAGSFLNFVKKRATASGNGFRKAM